MQNKNKAVWNTRFNKTTSKIFEKIGASIDIDKRLFEEDILGSSDYLRVELHNTASTEMIVHLDDFLRRRSKISLITRQEDIQNSTGLSEVGSILFGADAQTKLDEYFSSNSSPINPTK